MITEIEEPPVGLGQRSTNDAADLFIRLQADKSAEESEHRFREMIDALPAAIYTTDAEGRLTHFNPAAVEFSGHVPELGTDKWCVSWKLFRADGTPLPHDECPMAIALKEGRPIRGVEAIAERRDGTRVWFTPYPTPLLDASGKVIGGINMLVDITARKQAEEVRARLAAIVASSDDAIVSKNLNGIITSWNKGAKRLFGYTAEEAIGQDVTIIIPEDHFDEEPGIIERIRRGESIEHYETVRRRKDGTLLDISLTVSPIIDDSGRIVGASKIARDITARKRNEEALREAHELLADRAKHLEKLVEERTAKLRETVSELEAFSYSIAHDMRAPLRAMQGFANMLIEDCLSRLNADEQDYLRRISKSADRLDRLIQDVLNYSKVVRGEMKLEPVDVGRLVQEIMESYPNLQPPKAIIMVQAGLPVVLGNTAALTQAISNLLSNAAKFVAPGTVPHVRIRAEQNGEWTRLWFEDNGIGIRPEAIQRIFQMFGRVNPPDQFDGTGIGLTIVRKAVERMGGTVGVESEPGHGSRFWVQLKKAGAASASSRR